MNERQLRQLLQECLGHRFTTLKGQILYSEIDTLTRGDYYFLGFNPAERDTQVVNLTDRPGEEARRDDRDLHGHIPDQLRTTAGLTIVVSHHDDDVFGSWAC